MRTAALLALLAFCVGVVACNALLGLDGVTYRGPDGGAAGNGTGGSGNGGAPAGAGGSGTAGTFAAACTTYAVAVCTFYKRCFPKPPGAPGADVDCSATPAGTCATDYDRPGSNTHPADLVACAAAYESASCERFDQVFACTVPPGVVPAGGACVASPQCATGYCTGATADSCGVCAKSPYVLVPNGGSCVAISGMLLVCEKHHGCIDGTCQPIALEAETCSASLRCASEYALECRGGVCVPALRDGDPCDPTTRQCAADHYCKRDTNTCAALQERAPGQPCGSNDPSAVCTGGFCDCTKQDNQVCRAYPEGGQGCLPPLTCGASTRCGPGFACTQGLCVIASSQPPAGCGPQ